MSDYTRRDFLTTLVLAAMAFSIPGDYSAGSPPNIGSNRFRSPNGKLPNIIIILADDMGYGDPSCYGYNNEPGTYGYQRFKTPNIDLLAAEGMRLTDFYASCPVCSPSRAGLLTGRYPQRTGIVDIVPLFADGLSDSEVTFAELLKTADYTTGVFGKWHLGGSPEYNPVRHGFDRFRGFLSGKLDYHSHIVNGKHDWWNGNSDAREEGYVTHLITKHATNFIEENKDRPFCLIWPRISLFKVRRMSPFG